MTKIYKHEQPFHLESGKVLQQLQLAYTTLGSLNDEKDNVVWIFHALTANSNAPEWWPGLVGTGYLFDPEKYFIVCVNMPGSCYGSSNAFDVDVETGNPYYHSFPWFTTRDMIKAYKHLKKYLGIDKIHIGLGGSMGGQQLLEWAVDEPDTFEYIIPIATNAKHSPWGVAFNASQRLCIENDVTWPQKNEQAGIDGMKVARSIALISYRSYETYSITQQGFTKLTEGASVDDQVFNAESYQRYQGEKLAKRFNAFSYYFLSKGMDSHNVGRGRDSVKEALKKITAKTLVIGITTDILFPINEQMFLGDNIPGAKYEVIESLYGHDGFLLEFEKIETLIKAFVKN
ncbi:homoserine O-acetyltransferase [Chitinophagaceae bacterium LWZ2-11]